MSDALAGTHLGGNALVIGGGIAGTVAAIALKKAGIEPLLFESYDAGAEGVGAFLTLAVNGIDALEAVGIDVARLGGFETPRMAFSLGSGERLAEISCGPRLPSGAACRTIKRADLYTALRDEALRRGVTMAYGKRLLDTERLPSGRVMAHFEDGTTAKGDFLIGADGLHSRVRALLDPKAPKPRYVGLLNTGGYARGVDVPGEPGTMQMVFGKRCFFGYVKNPNGEVWWFANPGRAKEPPPRELMAKSGETWRTELLDAFAGDDARAIDVIRATESIMVGWGTYDMPMVPKWHDDRRIIIGDAAHATSPSSGQGASMAIEDAVVLAMCLRDEPTLEAAFSRYEKMRRDRVERVVAQGKKNGDGKTPGLVGRVIRDVALRIMLARMEKSGGQPFDWVYRHHLAWDA